MAPAWRLWRDWYCRLKADAMRSGVQQTVSHAPHFNSGCHCQRTHRPNRSEKTTRLGRLTSRHLPRSAST